MKTIQTIAAGLAAGALTLVSCTPTQQQYGLGGAVAGGAIGAIAGNDSGDIAKGIAVGGIAGAGYAAFRDHQNNQNGTYNTGGDYRQPTPAPAPVQQPAAPKYPTAHRSEIPGVVISPYKPYNKIRVTGFKPGQLAKDKAPGEIFVVPQ
jgi:hypothetical protein